MVDRLNAAITGVKAALEGKDTASIKAETEKLQKVLGEAGSAAYQEAAQRQAEQQAASAGCRDSPRRTLAVRAVRMLLMPISKSRMRNNIFSCTHDKGEIIMKFLA